MLGHQRYAAMFLWTGPILLVSHLKTEKNTFQLNVGKKKIASKLTNNGLDVKDAKNVGINVLAL